jgi:hypothetical protein
MGGFGEVVGGRLIDRLNDDVLAILELSKRGIFFLMESSGRVKVGHGSNH